MTAFLRLDDTHVYNGLEATRGPWSVDHCHAGPPAGAIARSVEIVAGPDKLLTRLTLDLIRPIPIAGFRVDVEMQREGRKVSTAAATLTDRVYVRHGTSEFQFECPPGTTVKDLKVWLRVN